MTVPPFVERHGLWGDAQRAAARRAQQEITARGIELVRFSFADQHGLLRGKTVAVLGLTYKPGTDTLRRSSAVELCEALIKAGATVRAFDPVVKQLPADLGGIALAASAAEALRGADVAAVCTEWPEFRQVNWSDVVPAMRSGVFVDANRFLEKELKAVSGVEHLSVGRA
ncbi:MAG: hypothetical protein HC807_08100 [Gammaproteobacteria bacterium]|nr:hypothetical protein [Gammaproteobacteria bacterium]